MKSPTPEEMAPITQIRRVLIGFGSAGADIDILDMACELAAALRVELAGVFVEEDMLYRLCELPTSRAIDACGRVVQSLDRTFIGRAIAGRAQACRRALSQRADRNHLHWSYEIKHGEALSIIGAGVNSDDLLLVAGTTTSTTPRAKMELAAHMRLALPGASLIVPDHLRRRSGPVAVLDPEGDGHVDLAGRMAASLGEKLIVLPGETLEAGSPRGTSSHAAQVLTSAQPRLLVARHSNEMFTDPIKAGELLRNLGVPILLVNS